MAVEYLAFLGRWYNLPFLGLVAAGLGLRLVTRAGRRRPPGLSVDLLAMGVVGLTLNGALHDFGVMEIGARFPVVLGVAAVAGHLIGRGVRALRRKVLPPVEGVAFTAPGMEGAEARIVSRYAGAQPASGRAQWQDEAGVLHIVRIHTGGEELRFGRRVRLVGYLQAETSYLVEPA
ncbi:MAG: hypothetical protein RRA92_01205 [Gemmatimonadota bacterium]|nr:hypothetical protein [Gemmatimonadota bacterium]